MCRLAIASLAAVSVALGLPVVAGAHHKDVPHIDCLAAVGTGQLAAPSPAELGGYDPFGTDEAGHRLACA